MNNEMYSLVYFKIAAICRPGRAKCILGYWLCSCVVMC